MKVKSSRSISLNLKVLIDGIYVPLDCFTVKSSSYSDSDDNTTELYCIVDIDSHILRSKCKSKI